jgi:xanthine dehydrogenase accessory factor
MPILEANRYGKHRVCVLRVGRASELHEVCELEADVLLAGDLEASYVSPDNSSIVPTDTVKDTVHALARLRCAVDVIDTRMEWLARLVKAQNVTAHWVQEDVLGLEQVKAKSFVLSLTKGHATDRPVLREVLRRYPDVPFVGVIGSAAKRAVLLRELREDGIREELLEKMVCPVGLPIGTNDPAEIAVSIVAQLLERRDQGRE